MSKSKHFKSPYLKTSIAASKSSSRVANPAYEVYISSLAHGGRKGMVSVLGLACRIMEWDKGAGYFPWHELSYEKVQKIRARLLELEFSINSVNLTLAGLRGIAKTAFNLELINGEQLMRIQAVQVVKGEVLRKGRRLNASEIKLIVGVCHKSASKIKAKRDLAIFLLGCGAGLRCSEIVGLNISSFDSEKGSIRVLNAKGMRQRELHLAPMIIKALNEWCRELPNDGSAMFRQVLKNSRIGSNRITKEGVATLLRNLQKQSQVKPFSPHTMRYTFVSQLLDDGVDINSVRQLAGHSQINTTARYDYRSSDAIKEVSRTIF